MALKAVPQDRRKDRHRGRVQHKHFCGVDGEGGNIDGKHEYLLLRAGTDHVLETGSPLLWHECLQFLADLPKDRIYVSFYFDYDVTMMLRDLPPERLERLLDRDARRIPDKPGSSFPVDVGDFQIDYLGRKEFKVRRRKKGAQWTIVQDVGSFFQCSFVVALQRWFGDGSMDSQIAKIAEGKAQRHDFGQVTEDERQYNMLEIIMLERMMEKFRTVCDELELKPHRWEGPGNLVAAVFQREKLPRNKDIPLFERDPLVAILANMGYYGGRFEVPKFGFITGPVYQYDINSAYANTYQKLPCMIHATWQKVKGLPRSGQYFAEVEFKHPAGLTVGTLPVRNKKGSILFPVEGRGIYWYPELDVARKYGVTMKVIQCYRNIGRCDCANFAFIDRMYEKRKELGKDDKGMVLKLALASTYGKLVQSVGTAPYANPVYGGIITSSVRAELVDAALSLGNGGSDVVMLATDGMFCTEPRPGLRLGTELGEWSLTEFDSMFVVQSGVYFLPGKKPKTRGVPQSKVIEHEPEFRSKWEHFLRTGETLPVEIPLINFVGMRLALARNKIQTAGEWQAVTKGIRFDFTGKRAYPEVVGESVHTHMMDGSSALVSVPYPRMIGGHRAKEAYAQHIDPRVLEAYELSEKERLEYADQPDWGDIV